MVLPNEAFGDRLLQVAQSVIQQRQNQQRFELQQKKFMAEMEQQKRMMDARAGEIDAKQRAFDIQQQQVDLSAQRLQLDRDKFSAAQAGGGADPLSPGEKKTIADNARRLRDRAGGIMLSKLGGDKGFAFNTLSEFEEEYAKSLKTLSSQTAIFASFAPGGNPAIDRAKEFVEFYDANLSGPIAQYHGGAPVDEEAYRTAYRAANPNVADDLIPPQPDPEARPLPPADAEAVKSDVKNGSTAQLTVQIQGIVDTATDRTDIKRKIRELFPNDPALQAQAAQEAARILDVKASQ